MDTAPPQRAADAAPPQRAAGAAYHQRDPSYKALTWTVAPPLTNAELLAAAREIYAAFGVIVVLNGEAADKPITPELAQQHLESVDRTPVGSIAVIPTSVGPVTIRRTAGVGGYEYPAILLIGAAKAVCHVDAARGLDGLVHFALRAILMMPGLAASYRFALRANPSGTIPAVRIFPNGADVELQVTLLRRGGEDYRAGLDDAAKKAISGFEASAPDADEGIYVEYGHRVGYNHMAAPWNAAAFNNPAGRTITVAMPNNSHGGRLVAVSYDELMKRAEVSAAGAQLWAHATGNAR